MLELKNNVNNPFVILSITAFNSLDMYQKEIIGKSCKLLTISIDTIETIGGGSTRCMIMENFSNETRFIFIKNLK